MAKMILVRVITDTEKMSTEMTKMNMALGWNTTKIVKSAQIPISAGNGVVVAVCTVHFEHLFQSESVCARKLGRNHVKLNVS